MFNADFIYWITTKIRLKGVRLRPIPSGIVGVIYGPKKDFLVRRYAEIILMQRMFRAIYNRMCRISWCRWDYSGITISALIPLVSLVGIVQCLL